MAATIQTVQKPLHPRALDTSGNNNHGTAYTGQALEFDGVSDYISFDAITLDGDFTFATWMKIDDLTGFLAFIGTTANGNNIIGFKDANASKLYIRFSTAGGSEVAVDPVIIEGEWYRVVFVRDKSASELYYYVNGALIKTMTASDVPLVASDFVPNAIGAWTSPPTYHADYDLADYQLWDDAAWTQSDVTYDYLNPERLALDNPGTSLTYSDLKLWYPMQDGHRGNQSFLLDGANTGGTKNHGTSVFYGDEMIANGDMELNSNWDTSGGINTAQSTGPGGSSHGGTYSWTFETNSAYDGIRSDTYTTITGRSYYYSLWVYPDDGTDIQVKRRTGGGSDSTLSTTALTQDQWNNITGTYVETSGGDAAYLHINSNNATSGVYYVDDVSVKEVGFASGWTDADVQATIPQLAFQSYNQLAWFDGDADYVSMGSPTVLDDFYDGGGTFCAWVFLNSFDKDDYPIIYHKNNANRFRFIEESGTTCKLGFLKSFDGDNASWKTSNRDINFGKWTFLALSYDADSASNTPTMYIDGASVSVSTSTPSGTRDTDASSSLVLGGDTTSYNLEGCITEISVFNKELSLAEVQELYNDGEALDALTHSSVTNLVGYWRNEGSLTWSDLSTNSNNGTPTSIIENLILPEGQNSRDTQGFLMNRVRTSGVNLDGVSAFVGDLGMGNAYGSDAMSIGCWFKCADVSSSTIQFIWGEAHYSAPSQYGFGLGILSSNLRGAAGNNATTVWDNLAYSISSDTWYNAVLVYDKDNGDTNDHFYRLYVDGVLRDSYDTDLVARFSGSYESYLIGCSGDHDAAPNYDKFFKGSIDDVTLYSTALSAAQVLRNYKAGKRRHKN